MKSILKLATFICTSLLFFSVNAQFVFTDYTYGDEGKFLYEFNTNATDEFITRVKYQSDGKLLLLLKDGTGYTKVVRLLTDGKTLDGTFGSKGLFDFLSASATSPKDLTLDKNGNIFVICEQALTSNTTFCFKLNSNGVLDPSFGSKGYMSFTGYQCNNINYNQTDDSKIISVKGGKGEYGIITIASDNSINTNLNFTTNASMVEGLLYHNQEYYFAENTTINVVKIDPVAGPITRQIKLDTIVINHISKSSTHLWVAGTYTDINRIDYTVLLKYNFDGTLEQSFNGSGMLIKPKQVDDIIAESFYHIFATDDGGVLVTMFIQSKASGKLLPWGADIRKFDSGGKLVYKDLYTSNTYFYILPAINYNKSKLAFAGAINGNPETSVCYQFNYGNDLNNYFNISGPTTISYNNVFNYAINTKLELKDYWNYEWNYTGEGLLFETTDTNGKIQYSTTPPSKSSLKVYVLPNAKPGKFYVVVRGHQPTPDTISTELTFQDVPMLEQLADLSCQPIKEKYLNAYINDFEIINSSFSNLNSGADSSGYSDFTALSPNPPKLYWGDVVNLKALAGGINQSEAYFGVWIDFNNNGSFGDPGEFVAASSQAGDSYLTGYINMPDSSLNTNLVVTRMRVKVRPFDAITIADSCKLDVDYGEIEDYMIQIEYNYDLKAPNLLTPNGDYKNDVFIVHGMLPGGDNELIVFDKLGNKVYAQRDYNNLWNGVDNNGKQLTEGTYYYLFKYGRNRLKGFVEIKY